MRPLGASLVLLLLAYGLVDAQQRVARCYPKSACKAECDATKQEIRKIQAKMRQGYSASQGAKMEAKLRDLRKRRSRLCQ